MAPTLPKLSLPKLQLPNKRMLYVAGGVVIVAAAGWFGWQYFEDAAPAPVPPSKPQPVTAAKQPAAAKAAAAAAAADAALARDRLIADLLAASGLDQQLSRLPQQLIAGVRQSSRQQPKASPAVLAAIEKAVTESFTAQSFQDRMNADLRKNFDQKRMQALLADMSTPAAKRMIELEQAAPAQEELTRFARSQAASKLSAERKELIRRIDAATRASELALEAAFASMKAVALGIVGGEAQKSAAVDQVIEKQRAAATANIRNSTFANLAFTYRNASDADLEAQAKLYEGENSKWFSGIVYASLVEEARGAAARAGERIGALVSKPATAAIAEAKPTRSKSRGDARACLDLAADAAIIRCAQQYR
jgi:hypothetical protein